MESCAIAETVTGSPCRSSRAWQRSEGFERQEHAGMLGADCCVGRRLPPDLLGEFTSVILVGGADDQEPPAPHDRPALAAQLARQRDRLTVRRKLDPCLPLGDAAGDGLSGLRLVNPLVLRLKLGLGPRQRDLGVFPLLFDGMPAVQSEVRLDTLLGQHRAGNPLSLPRRDLGACIQEDLRVTGTDGDTPAEPTAEIFFNLMTGKE